MIKFLVMDVDGTLTDGKVYMGAEGECFKAFDIKDGYALHTMLKEGGIVPVVITARKSCMVEHRCKELGVNEVHQGVLNKIDCLNGIIQKYSTPSQRYNLSNVAYIGDDLLDLQCITPINAAGGITGCPSNATQAVIARCDFISPHKGGEGAVRDFAEFLISHNTESIDAGQELHNRCLEAVEYLTRLSHADLSVGRHDVNDAFYYIVQEYVTDNDTTKAYESHRRFIDIQLLIDGEEMMQITDISRLRTCCPYDDEKDRMLYSPSGNESGVVLRPGSVMVLYPKDAHRSISVNGRKNTVKKVVGKLKIIFLTDYTE